MEPEEEQTSPILNLEGERAALGPLRRELVSVYRNWMNNFETVATLGRIAKPVTTEAQVAWLKKLLLGTETDVLFTIYERRTGGSWRPVGCCGLNEIDHAHGKATLGIVIGEPEARGRGVGTETVKLLLHYGFNRLHLHNIMLTVFSFNPGAIRCYEKAGFKLIGRRRESRRHLGGRHAEVYMDVLASEFTSPLPR